MQAPSFDSNALLTNLVNSNLLSNLSAILSQTQQPLFPPAISQSGATNQTFSQMPSSSNFHTFPSVGLDFAFSNPTYLASFPGSYPYQTSVVWLFVCPSDFVQDGRAVPYGQDQGLARNGQYGYQAGQYWMQGVNKSSSGAAGRPYSSGLM